jgi:hypothetical protein
MPREKDPARSLGTGGPTGECLDRVDGGQSIYTRAMGTRLPAQSRWDPRHSARLWGPFSGGARGLPPRTSRYFADSVGESHAQDVGLGAGSSMWLGVGCAMMSEYAWLRLSSDKGDYVKYGYVLSKIKGLRCIVVITPCGSSWAGVECEGDGWRCGQCAVPCTLSEDSQQTWR